MNGHVSKEGITADLEALKGAGIGGAQIFDVGCNVPRGKKDSPLLPSGLLGPVVLRFGDAVTL